MKKKKNNTVPAKNYVLAFVLSLFAIFLAFYIFSWYDVYKEKKYNESYLIRTNTISLEVNDIEEIENTFTEAPNEYFVYIGYRNDEEIYKLEKKLKTIIDRYNINDNFYYIDVTDLKGKVDYIEKLNTALKLTNEKIKTVPTILYFKDGILVKDGIVKSKENQMIASEDFEQLLQKFGYKK